MENSKTRRWSKLDLSLNSTYINQIMLFVLVGLLILLHLFLRLFCCRVGGWTRNIVNKVTRFIFYTIYLRLFIEAYLCLLWSSAAEMHQYRDKSGPTLISLIITSVIVALCVGLLAVNAFYFLKHWVMLSPNANSTLAKKFFSMEIFEGFKNTRWAKIYTLMVLSRRLILVIVIILLDFIKRDTTYFIVFLIQVAFWMMVRVVRSLNELVELW